MVSINSTRRTNASSFFGIISQRRLVYLILAVIAAMMACCIFLFSSVLDKQQQQNSVRLNQSLQSPVNNAASQQQKQPRLENEDESPPVVIAHAISLIKCSKKTSVTGFIDAAAVLRHSIHKNSIHNTSPRDNNVKNAPSTTNDNNNTPKISRYSYQMYAIVHTSCEEHAQSLKRLGYKILVKDHPVKKDDIQDEYLRNHIEAENCCGSAEFIKLYAYTLTNHPIVIHWDMDVAILQPLDDLFDVMLYPATHPRSVAAKGRIERQHEDTTWPETINAFLTRDITSAKPWEKITAVQGGFLVARPDVRVFDEYIKFIKEGNYKPGRGDGSGWYGMGYGGFQGAMAYQGVLAYYYDQIAPNTAVELNVCRWNQVAADVIWRGPERKEQHHLQCRDYPRTNLANGEPDFASNIQCEDCRMTPVEQVKTVHYTACKKPWECQIANPRVPRDKRQVYRLQNLVNIDNCSKLVREWFKLRQEFEDALEIASKGQVHPSPRDGDYYKEYFLGYCNGENGGNYIAIELPPDEFDIKKVYGM